MKELSAEEIIEGIKKKDNAVMEYIYQKYYPPILLLITRNQGTPEDAKDIFQETIIVIYRKLRDDGKIVLTCSFSTYLYSVARNLWLNQLRRKRIEPEKLSEITDFMDIDPDIPGFGESETRRKIFQKHFLRLPRDCQDILRLSLENIPQKEIASKLGFKSENYVKKRKHYCREMLIKSIKKDPLYKDLMGEGD